MRSMAEAFNAEMAPHLYAGPIEWAANLHLCTASPERADCRKHLDAGLLSRGAGERGPTGSQAGHVEVGDAPGLGLEIDEDGCPRARLTPGTDLHLEMQETPHVYDETTYFAGRLVGLNILAIAARPVLRMCGCST